MGLWLLGGCYEMERLGLTAPMRMGRTRIRFPVKPELVLLRKHAPETAETQQKLNRNASHNPAELLVGYWRSNRWQKAEVSALDPIWTYHSSLSCFSCFYDLTPHIIIMMDDSDCTTIWNSLWDGLVLEVDGEGKAEEGMEAESVAGGGELAGAMGAASAWIVMSGLGRLGAMDDRGSGSQLLGYHGRVGWLWILEDWRDLAWRAYFGLMGCLDWCQKVLVHWWLRRADFQGVLFHSNVFARGGVLELVDAVRARHVTPVISIYCIIAAEPYFAGFCTRWSFLFSKPQHTHPHLAMHARSQAAAWHSSSDVPIKTIRLVQSVDAVKPGLMASKNLP
ncbi:hypothetical protein M405DRAFT_847980 [Rhizopogon salebrosus TDB-379]|nr:hypothetical protein M405DRAFT_847980 [Rhizopogon salebrosus TDB-379]